MPQPSIESPQAALADLAPLARAFFAQAAAQATNEQSGTSPQDIFSGESVWTPDFYWKQLDSTTQSTAISLISKLLPICAAVAESARRSALTGTEDTHDVKVAAKKARAALRLRAYKYRRADVLHDEGSVLGFQPAEQSEPHSLEPARAETEFFDALEALETVLRLVESTTAEVKQVADAAAQETTKYRTGTAFIMMWMDPAHPELTDVADCVRSVFKTFGVRAVRADDIEHEGLITERVINEIRTSEFLFADLTGMRPNVYYEIGYAHALGKRVILFRKAGTGVHFDLAGYNCPEYENLRDLRNKLSKRLVEITNRNPAAHGEI